MLSFPSQNDKKKFSDRPCVLEKKDPGDHKPRYFKVWPNSYNIFSANRAFPLHAVLFISKNFNLNVHALFVVPSATATAVC